MLHDSTGLIALAAVESPDNYHFSLPVPRRLTYCSCATEYTDPELLRRKYRIKCSRKHSWTTHRRWLATTALLFLLLVFFRLANWLGK